MSCKLPPAIQFLSTLPARGATVVHLLLVLQAADISIHAPREGSDGCVFLLGALICEISIHAPREGSDAVCCLA